MHVPPTNTLCLITVHAGVHWKFSCWMHMESSAHWLGCTLGSHDSAVVTEFYQAFSLASSLAGDRSLGSVLMWQSRGWERLGDGPLMQLVSVGFSFGIGMLPRVQSEYLSCQGLSWGGEEAREGSPCSWDCFGGQVTREDAEVQPGERLLAGSVTSSKSLRPVRRPILLSIK